MAVSQGKLAWLTSNLGILWISVSSFWLCESIVANPIIYRLVPRPSRFETRQLSKQNTEASLASLSWNSSQAPTEWSAIFAFGVLCTLKKVLRQPHNVLTLQVSLSLRAPGGFSFHRSYKHTIYCATKLVSPYVFFFVFCIARSRTVWVTVIFKARFQPRGGSCFFSFVGDLS